nr:hypothetical protein GCM10020093_076930 [Planobispora longispora]
MVWLYGTRLEVPGFQVFARAIICERVTGAAAAAMISTLSGSPLSGPPDGLGSGVGVAAVTGCAGAGGAACAEAAATSPLPHATTVMSARLPVRLQRLWVGACSLLVSRRGSVRLASGPHTDRKFPKHAVKAVKLGQYLPLVPT